MYNHSKSELNDFYKKDKEAALPQRCPDQPTIATKLSAFVAWAFFSGLGS